MTFPVNLRFLPAKRGTGKPRALAPGHHTRQNLIMAGPLLGAALLLFPIAAFAGVRPVTQSIKLDQLAKLSDSELRSALIGKAANADPSGKMASGMGWNEYFHKDGAYGRDTDRAFTTGRYTISKGQICITIDRASDSPECRSVYRSTNGLLYFHRSTGTRPAPPWKIVVTPLTE